MAKKKHEVENGAVAWEVVCTMKWDGGLGIPNLHWLNKALQARWPWLQKVVKDKPLKKFQINVPARISRPSEAAACRTIDDGRATLFREDRWINGRSVCEIAPLLHACIPKRQRKSRTVVEGLHAHLWARDIHGVLGVHEIDQYLLLW